MCGRFVNHLGAMHTWTDLLQDWPGQGQLSFNIAPTQRVPIVTKHGCQIYRWGLLPSWVKQTNPGFSTFNARLHTLTEKPSFKHAWSTGQRCIVPILGYYEWRDEPQGKQPYFVCRQDSTAIFLGGLYELPQHDNPGSFTVITRPAQGKLQDLHHAMPLMFEYNQAQQWLDDNNAMAHQLAHYEYLDDYQYYAVSSRVNKVANQGADLITPIMLPTNPQQGFDF